MSDKVNKVISGIRPTGKLHLGNYIGSILPALKYNADVLIATRHAPSGDYHSLAEELRKYFPEERIIFQGKRFNSLLFFKLLEVTPSHLLNAMPQYKAKEKTGLMYVYPVLMAHDMAGYDKVVVGDDQRPHIELAKDILHRVGEKCPEPIYEGGRVMDLRHPDRKMSKSTPKSCLFLSDSPEVRKRKIQRAVTDDKGRANLEFIYTSLGGETIPKLNSELKDKIIQKLGEF